MKEEEKQSLFEDLMKKKMNFGLLSFVAHYMSDTEMQSPSLAELLGIDETELTVNGKRVLQFLETEKSESTTFNFEDFKWKVHAFLSIQDLLFPQIFDETHWDVILQIRYFYYESKYVLTESIHSSLNGMHVGNNHLLRLFIEFNLLQVYYIKKGIKERSYNSFTEYFKTGVKPGSNSLIRDALPDDEFCKPIKKRIQWDLNRLSNRFSHAYTQANSPKAIGIAIPHTSIDSVYFYVQVSTVLDSVLWMYYVNFPMLFSPVDIIKKFGFSPPSGVFSSLSTAAIIKKSLIESDYSLFREYALKNEIVSGHMDWYNSLPDLTEEQIWETATEKRGPNDSITMYHVKQLATFRAQCEMLVEVIRGRLQAENGKPENDIDPDIVASYMNFNKWREIYGKL